METNAAGRRAIEVRAEGQQRFATQIKALIDTFRTADVHPGARPAAPRPCGGWIDTLVTQMICAELPEDLSGLAETAVDAFIASAFPCAKTAGAST